MFSKSILFLSFVMASTQLLAEATPWKNHENYKCKKEFAKLAAMDNFQDEKFREQVGTFNSKVYRNLSSVLGRWYEVHMTEMASPVVYIVSDTIIEKKSFDQKCNILSAPESWPVEMADVMDVKTPEDWSNEDLRKQIARGKPGMIYYWSPKFSYSVYDMPRVEKLAQENGYEIIAVVDPRASKKEVEGAMKVLNKSLKKKSDRNLASTKTYLRNTSTDLFMRSGFNHFPVTYIYNNNKIHPRWITGIMTDEGLKSMAQEFVGELK